MLVDKQNELMSDVLFTVHQHGGDDVTWKPHIEVILCEVLFQLFQSDHDFLCYFGGLPVLL